jgi:hypothetical protein
MNRQEITGGGQLVSDAERGEAEEQLRAAAVEGRLTLAEYSDRLDTVLTARTDAELVAATRGLPGRAEPLPARQLTSRIVTVMSEHKRSGRWRASGTVEVISVMATCKIDLRTAEIVGRELVLNVRAVMSSVEIFAPPHVRVELDPFSLMASTKESESAEAGGPEQVVVYVRGLNLMSSIEVIRDGSRRF